MSDRNSNDELQSPCGKIVWFRRDVDPCRTVMVGPKWRSLVYMISEIGDEWVMVFW